MSIKKASPGRGTLIKQPCNSTKLELADQILARFRGRDDVIGVSIPNGFSPEWLTKPLTAKRFADEHLDGRRCLALYLMREDNQVEATCLDFDDKPDRPDQQISAKVEAVVQCLRKHSLNPLVERSQSGRGVHVWLFLEKPRSAWFVRAVWRGILQHLNLPLGTEVFPRQDERNVTTGKGLGNPIRFPLWGKSRFVDVSADRVALDPMAALTSIVPVKLAEFKQLASNLGIRLKKPKKTASFADGSLLPGSLSPRVVQLLADVNGDLARRWRGKTEDLMDKSRSGVVSSIASLLVYRFVPTNEIESAIKRWCELNDYERCARQDWIESVIAGAYKFAWHKYELRRRGFSPRPSPHLPPSHSREFRRRAEELASKKQRNRIHD